MSLLTHTQTKTRKVSVDDLRDLTTPAAAKSWVPISHHAFADVVLTEVDQLWPVKQVDLVVGRRAKLADGSAVADASMFGIIETQKECADGVGFTIIFRNNVAKQFAARLGCGTRVFLCDNMAFTAEHQLSRKHTANIRRDLPELVRTMLRRIEGSGVQAREHNNIIRMQQTPLTEHDRYAGTLINLVRAGGINWQEARRIDSAWKLRHDNGVPGITAPDTDSISREQHPALDTVWALHNICTSVLRKRIDRLDPSSVRRTAVCHRRLVELCN